MTRFAEYYRLTKPGIVYGNAIHSVAGSLFAWSIAGPNLLAVCASLIGTSLIIASACVVNCITDRDLDRRMQRTKHRPLVVGAVSVRGATICAIILALVGSSILLAWVNVWCLAAILLCHLTYTTLYAYAKRHSWLGAAVGTIPGALPMAAGYLALDPRFTPTMWLLTALIVLWQLPHFYALAVYRRDDYARSKLPIISVVKSPRTVLWHIIVAAGLYVIVAASMIRFAAIPFPASMLLFIVAFWWLVYILKVSRLDGSVDWARSVFKSSLLLSVTTFVAAIVAVVVV